MKILLTNPPFYDEDENKWHGIRAGCRWPFIFNSPKPPANTPGYNTYPFYMGYAASFLAYKVEVGDVFFYDACALRHDFKEFYDSVKQLKPDITIIETSTPSINIDLKVAETIKSMGSEVALVGPHATAMAEELIKLPQVDYILQGEYEMGAFEMCLMRKKNHIYKCRPIINIDTIPLPYRDKSVYFYADGFSQDQFLQFPQLQVWTSRGCPYKCNFCLWRDTMTFNNYRPRSVKGIIKEVTACMRNYGFKSVLFDDDTFNVGDQRTIEISEAMDKIDIQWHAMVRADSCSKRAFKVMKECGCVGLKIGIESFSQRGLDNVKKGYKSEELIDTIEYLVSIGFKLYLSLMEDIHGETEDDKAFTKKWKDYFYEKGVRFQHPTCMPLPGTDYYKSLDKEGKLDKSDWKKFGLFHNEVIKK